MADDPRREAALAALRELVHPLAQLTALAFASAAPSTPPSREQVAREAWAFDQKLGKLGDELGAMEATATAEALALGERLSTEADQAVAHELAGEVCRKVDLIHQTRGLRGQLAAMRISREEVAQAMERRCAPAAGRHD